MGRWLSLIALLGGCDKLFSLTTVPDVVIDASLPDATVPDASGPTLAPWTATTSLPSGRDYNHPHAAFVSDTLFMVGGFDVTDNLETAIVYRATFASGELGAWTETTPLPAARALGDVVTIDQRLYVVGGANFGGAQISVYVGDVTTAGEIPSWSATTQLPKAIKAHSAVAANGYVYSVGGGDANNVRLADVYVAPVEPNGNLGAWLATTSLPSPRANLCAVAARGYLYAIGGDDDQMLPTATVYVAALDPMTGTVGPWSTATPLPAPLRGSSVVTDSNHIYVIGGEGGAASAEVLHSQIADDGTLGPWESAEPLLLPRYRHAAVLSNGLLFVLGGASTPTSVERSSQLAP
jgi:N-acetylneuraminic acid mutarotase